MRLGVNIDHVATVRNARGGDHPDPVRAALAAAKAGADGITAHLREDRRHIIDADVQRLRDEQPLPLNFEMAATADMLRIALDLKPHACCLVPERREERTTEGGLDVSANPEGLRTAIATLKDAGIRVSLFIEADARAIAFAAQAGADIVELHTGRYCDLLVEGAGEDAQAVYRQLEGGAWLAHDAGLEVHAGHGLRYDSAQALAALSQVVELNIGHFMVGE
ncbi:MAG: pyridoxine 5'-phosphate synthase, partial [Pseudomonadota bacterium]